MLKQRSGCISIPALLATILALSAGHLTAQPATTPPWFGVTPPPGFQPEVAPVIIGSDYGPRPALVPQGEENDSALAGEALRRELEAIVGFSKWSRETSEVGTGQLWGRITGLPSGDRTMDWVEERFTEAGVAEIDRQWFDQTAGTSLWLPHSWEVRIHGSENFGAGSRDVVLESAMPADGTVLPPEGLTAPLIFVGTARAAELEYIDVRGKIAVQHITPKGHLFLERGPARAKAQELINRGAVAVFNIVDQIGIVPGASEENTTINAHVDGWFDGANDNADGLAVMVGLAEHFSKPENRPSRTLVFVGSAGHHTPGLNGPDQLVELNPELIARNVLTVNLEHVAAMQINPARTATNGVRDVITDAGEGFLMNGLSERSPFIESVIREGGLRYGLNFVSQASTYGAGDNPDVESILFQLIQGNPLYHTNGDMLETISTPGLERVARFMAYFIEQIGVAPREQL